MLMDRLSQLPFEHRVDALVSSALESNITGFPELLTNLPGIFPSALLASLRRLRRSAVIGAQHFLMLEHEAKTRRDVHTYDQSLPPPHPLNYEWRFTRESAQFLLNVACRSTSPGGTVLLFGTPGVARASLRSGIPQSITFLGEDNEVSSILRTENEKLGSPLDILLCGDRLPCNDADAVIIDPPWYQEYISAMLTSAAVACKVGGKVYFSLAPIGTSRSVYAQRAEVIRLALSLGLQLERIEAGALRYETPFFEANALSACGLSPVAEWRNADLVAFTKVAHVDVPSDTNCLNTDGWQEVNVGRMRLFIRNNHDCDIAYPFRLQPLVPGEVLPSVSRRDPRRHDANIWTSGNRIFKTNDPSRMLRAVNMDLPSLIYDGRSSKFSKNELDELLRIKYVLSSISQREAEEEAGLFDEKSHCPETLTMRRSFTASRTTKFGRATSITSSKGIFTRPFTLPYSPSHTCQTSSMG